MRRPVALCGAALAALILAAPAAHGQGQGLDVQLFPDRIEVRNAAEGGSVALLSAERIPVGFSSRVTVVTRSAEDADGDGVVSIPLEEPPAESSVWLAVDAQTGRYGAVSPIEGAPFPFRTPLGLAADPGSTQVPAVDGHARLHVLLSRNGGGVWHAEGADGGLAEETGVADGRLLLIAPAWELLAGAGNPPTSYRSSDLLIALDPDTLELDARTYGGLDALP